MGIVFYVIICLLILCYFFIIRNSIMGRINHKMADIAIKQLERFYNDESIPAEDYYMATMWYNKWSIVSAVFNPLHFNKWTTKQWVKYLTKKHPIVY